MGRVDKLYGQESREPFYCVNDERLRERDTKHYIQWLMRDHGRADDAFIYARKDPVVGDVLLSFREMHPATGEHLIRSARVNSIVGDAMGLGNDALAGIVRACFKHDTGKLFMPELLSKPSLTEQDWNRIRQHPFEGYKVLMKVAEPFDAAVAYLHHTFQENPYPVIDDRIGRFFDPRTIEAAKIVAYVDSTDARLTRAARMRPARTLPSGTEGPSLLRLRVAAMPRPHP